MAHVGKLEPTVLVIPNSELVSEGLPVEIEYLQENFIREVMDCHGSGGRAVGITGATVSFGGS